MPYKAIHTVLFGRKVVFPSGATAITVIIVIAWIVTFLMEFIQPDFESPSSLDPLMLMVIGAFITARAVRTKKEGDDE